MRSPFDGFGIGSPFGRRRAAGGGVPAPTLSAQTAMFPASTPAGAGGFQPFTSLGEQVVLTSVVSQVGATRTWSINGAGDLVANGTPDVDNGRVIVCGTAMGPVSITIDSSMAGRAYRTVAELTTVFNLSAAAKSGLMVYGRTGAYDFTNALMNGKFEGLTDWCAFGAAHADYPPTWTRAAVVNTTATGNTQGYLRLEDMNFYLPVGVENKRVGNLSIQTNIIEVADTNPVANVHVRRCVIRSDAPNARLTGNRPAQYVTAFNCKRGSNIVYEDNIHENLCVGASMSVTTGSAVRRNIHRFCWDDPVRIVATAAVPDVGSVEIVDNLAHDFIGDHGFHPDAFHMFHSGAGDRSIASPVYRGNVVFVGSEGVLQPAWPVSVDGGAYDRDAGLTTSSFTMAEADHERFIFLDATTGPITVTLPSPSAWVNNARDMVLQVWSPGYAAPANPITIDPDVTLYDFDNDENITDFTLTRPWQTIQLRADKAGNRWTLHRQGPAYQGIQTGGGAIVNGVANADLRGNIVWMVGNSVNGAGGSASSNWTVVGNSFMPPWSDGPEYQPQGETRFISLNAGTGHATTGNIAGSVDSFAGGSGNLLAADLNLNNVWAAFADNFNVPDPAVQIVNPTTLAEAIEYARPKTNFVLGYGAPLGLTAADDYYNFGQHPLELRGYRTNTPWHIRTLAVVPAGGGFAASWLAPADQSQGAVSGYVVEYAINGGAFVTLTGWAEGDNNTGLSVTSNVSATIDDSIVVRVRARNTNGNGPLMTAPAIVVVSEGDVAITPTALRAVYTDGVQATSKTITTTTSASGDHPVQVVASFRYSGAGSTLQAISATLNGTAMLSQSQQISNNFQICKFWATSADVPSGTWNVVLSNGTANFNGMAVRIEEMVNAADDQTGAVMGTASSSPSITSRTASINTAGTGSYVYAASCSQNALTGITGQVDTFRDGTEDSGNAVTFAGFAGTTQDAAGAEAVTFTQSPASQMIAVAFEVIQ